MIESQEVVIAGNQSRQADGLESGRMDLEAVQSPNQKSESEDLMIRYSEIQELLNPRNPEKRSLNHSQLKQLELKSIPEKNESEHNQLETQANSSQNASPVLKQAKNSLPHHLGLIRISDSSMSKIRLKRVDSLRICKLINEKNTNHAMIYLNKIPAKFLQQIF